MVEATWNGVVIARSDDTIVVEVNHYFPRASVDPAVLKDSTTTSVCGWKGLANYHSIEVNGRSNPDCAWFYADPKPGAAQVRDRVAFWKGVAVR